jgi:hypothetical protein
MSFLRISIRMTFSVWFSPKTLAGNLRAKRKGLLAIQFDIDVSFFISTDHIGAIGIFIIRLSTIVINSVPVPTGIAGIPRTSL